MEAHSADKARFPIQIYKTSGDRLRGDLAQFGGKGLFTKELETALIDGEIDLAVHSMKDVPTQSQEALTITAVLPREDPRDAFISNAVTSLLALPQGAVLGTASIRRRAQLSSLRPDITYTLLRGNVGTRLGKLDRGDCDATFLACAGLKRLNQGHLITEAISKDLMLPAPAQGAIGVEIRKEDQLARDWLSPLNHRETHWAILAERAFLMALDGSCRTPIAALATLDADKISFRGEVYSKDGRLKFNREERASCASLEDAFSLGLSLGRDLKAEIGDLVLWDDEIFDVRP